LSNIGASGFASLVVAVPYFVYTGDGWASVSMALPFLLITMATFVLNDIYDLERDHTNHPDRPLPTGLISIHLAAITYVVLAISSLLSIKLLIPIRLHFFYLVACFVGVNYNFAVGYLPWMKNPLVGAASSIPILVVYYSTDRSLASINLAAATFVFITSREALMDIRDWAGDGKTLVKFFSAERAGMFAFALQLLAFGAMLPALAAAWQAYLLAALALLTVLNGLVWRSGARQSTSFNITTAQLGMSAAFLFRP
jgi:4-hydroxybenzoate polyprenyltransferase